MYEVCDFVRLIMVVYRCLSLIRFLFVSTTICTSVTSFDEVPSSLIVSPGTEATFRCRYQAADIIGWLVNGTSIGQIINSDITPGTIRYEGGILVHTLTILAYLKYNNSEVECVASFVHQQLPPELSPVVTLSVLEGINETSHAGFVRVPSSFNGIEGSEITFTCQHASTNAIKWFINGTFLINGDYPSNIMTNLNISDGVAVHSLLIHPPITNYNGTIIQCVAFIEIQPERTLPAVLLVQGSLQSISSLARNTNTLSWIAPFSLDLTDVDPDIVYCVEVYNITCGRSLLISECDVTETSYTNDALLPGYIYEYTVTSRSNVEAARNGRTDMVIEQFICFIESAMGWTVSIVNRNRTSVILSLDFSHQTQGAIQPLSYSTSLKSIDGVQDYDGLTLPVAAIPSGNESSVDIILEVPFRRVFDVKVLAYDCKEHPLTKAIELGSHDVYNIMVSSPLPGIVMVMGNIVIGSTSRGILAIVYSLNPGFDISYRSVPHNSTQPGVYSMDVRLPDDLYEVAIFVIEESGQPFPRAASRPKSVFINQSGVVQHEQTLIEYELQDTSTGVCITCTFLDSSTTDCVAVVHQRISQLSSNRLMNIESSHKFNRSGDTAYGCIEGVNLTNYQVGVIGADLILGMTTVYSDCSGCIIGSTLGLYFLVLLLSLITYFLMFLYIQKRRYKKDDRFYEISNTKFAKTYNQECGEVEESHIHTTEVELTNLARSVSDVDVSDIDSSPKMHTIPINKDYHDIPITVESGINSDSDSILHSIAEEQPSAVSRSMFPPGEESQLSLCDVPSDDWDRPINNIAVPVTKCTKDSDEAVRQTDYPVVELESGFEGTSSLTLPNQGSLIHISSPSKIMRRLEPFVSIRDTYYTDDFEESTGQSCKFDTCTQQLEMSRLVVGDREGFPIQVTDQNLPAASDHIILPNVFFRPHHKSTLSHEDPSVEQTSYIYEVSGVIEAKQERGQLLRSPRRSTFRGQPEGAADSKLYNWHSD